MSSTKKITIITPSYNQGQYLEQTIDSVLSQNYSNLEYILIDGASTDNSLAIIKKHAKHLAHWVSEPDRGQSHAINKGLKLAQGDIINWLNSDDYYEPNVLAAIAEAFRDPLVKCVCAKGNIVRDSRTINRSQGTDVYPSLSKTIGCARIDQPETFFRKNVYDQIGLLNENFHYLMDREFWIRFLLTFGISGVNTLEKVVVNFRLHATSKTQSQQEGFEKEWHTLIGSLAKNFGFSGHFDFIKREWNLNSALQADIHFDDRQKQVVADALGYYLINEADKSYYQFNWKRTERIFDYLAQQNIPIEEIPLFHKLNFRIKWLPKWLARILREKTAA